jgi:TetR/AcrR family transcriptional regulator, fatty acid metabolism regulator protein
MNRSTVQSIGVGTGMNQPKTSDVKETIIRESMKLFLAYGFRGTSVKEITEAAGIGRGTLYWYFKSKDEIVETILQKFESEFVEGLIKAVNSCEGNFVAKYRAFHKFATEFARDSRDLALVFNALLSEIVGSNRAAEAELKAIYEKYRRFLEGMLEDGKRDGSVRPDIDSAVYAHVIIASHTGMLVQWFVNGKSLNVEAFVRTFRDLILKGATKKGG